ncbi:hypothetical protein B566_EDAN010468 [Ephemera danica]|nr:hypothetical protein B566_EDAN010468 [Ephemera danica]
MAGKAYTESRAPNNPFKLRKEPEDLAHTQLSLLMLLPGVGRKKCQELLNKFGHFQGIANASEFDLAGVVGQAAATSVCTFFHTPYVAPK